MSMNEAENLGSIAAAQPVSTDDVQELLGDIQGRSSRFCDVEYGTNRDDGRLVFHFFPPRHAADNAVDWADWKAFRDRLETAILAAFKPEDIEAGWVEELKSFYLLAKQPQTLDLTAFLSKFFETLETE